VTDEKAGAALWCMFINLFNVFFPCFETSRCTDVMNLSCHVFKTDHKYSALVRVPPQFLSYRVRY